MFIILLAVVRLVFDENEMKISARKYDIEVYFSMLCVLSFLLNASSLHFFFFVFFFFFLKKVRSLRKNDGLLGFISDFINVP